MRCYGNCFIDREQYADTHSIEQPYGYLQRQLGNAYGIGCHLLHLESWSSYRGKRDSDANDFNCLYIDRHERLGLYKHQDRCS